MQQLTQQKAKLLAEYFEAEAARLSECNPDNAKAIINIVAAIRQGHVRGSQLSLARDLARG